MSHIIKINRLIASSCCLLVAMGLMGRVSSYGAKIGGHSASAAIQPTWSQWRGPNRDGMIPGPEWPDRMNEDNLKQIWHVELSEGYPGPIVSEDEVFVVETRDKKDEIVRALDRKTGREIWRQEWPGSMKVPFFADKNGSWVRSTPAYDGERLYVGGMRDHLVALDAKSGEVLWSVDFMKRYGTDLPAFGLASSPMIWNGDLFIQSADSFMKIDKHTGETIWRTLADNRGDMTSGGAFSSPFYAELHGRPTLLVQTRQEITGVCPDSGEVLWRKEVPSFRGMNILTPTVYKNSIFTSTYRNKAFLYDILKRDGDFDINLSWKSKAVGYMSSPVIINGHAYLHLQSQRFTCVDLETGEEKWRSNERFGDYWSLAAQGDRLLALDSDGELLYIQATPEEFIIKDRLQISDQSTWGHIAVAGNNIYVRELKGISAYHWEQ